MMTGRACPVLRHATSAKRPGRRARHEVASMSPRYEELLDGFPGDETPPSQRTRRVAELLRMPGARERWRQRCQESFRESRERHERHGAWQAGRDQYLAEAA